MLHMKCRTDLNLSNAICIFIFILDFLYWMVCIFIFDGMTVKTENSFGNT